MRRLLLLLLAHLYPVTQQPAAQVRPAPPALQAAVSNSDCLLLLLLLLLLLSALPHRPAGLICEAACKAEKHST
jgi:hypothetical protein